MSGKSINLAEDVNALCSLIEHDGKRIDRYTIVAKGLAEGLPQSVIAQQVGVAQPQISRDKAEIIKFWLQQQTQYLDIYKVQELNRIEHREKEAWQEWHKSKLERKKITETRVDKDDKGKVVKKQIVTETMCGDPRYLDVIAKCGKDRRELLGLDAPIRSENLAVVIEAKLPEGMDITKC